MSKDTIITGLINDWYIVTSKRKNLIRGSVYHDIRNRWPDGMLILTSEVTTNKEELKEGTVVETLNSRYLLGISASDMSDRAADLIVAAQETK